MLRALYLAAFIALSFATTSLACVCVTETGEQQLAEVMTDRELRILLPIRHSLQLDPTGDESRNTIITTHRVIDPLGLRATDEFKTMSKTSYCSGQPRLGVINTFTTWHDGSHPLPGIVSCNTPHTGVAARYQQDGSDRRIPPRDACLSLSNFSPRARQSMNAERLANVNTESSDPMCEFWDSRNEGPLAIAFRDRTQPIVAAQAGRHGLAVRRPRGEHVPPAPHATDPRPRIYGLPIHAEMTDDGKRRTHVLIYQDFGQIVPKVVEVIKPVFEGYDDSLMQVGQRGRFLLGPDGTLEPYAETSLTLDDPLLFRQVMGGPLPKACRPEGFGVDEPCDLGGKEFWDAEHALFDAPIDQTELAEAIAGVPNTDQ